MVRSPVNVTLVSTWILILEFAWSVLLTVSNVTQVSYVYFAMITRQSILHLALRDQQISLSESVI
jgi:hypothetical protein